MGAGERHKMRDTIDMLFTTLTIRAVVITVIMIVRENGGYIVHAHPFREKANAYISSENFIKKLISEWEQLFD